MDVKASICFYSLASIIAFTTMLENHDQKSPGEGAGTKKKKAQRSKNWSKTYVPYQNEIVSVLHS